MKKSSPPYFFLMLLCFVLQSLNYIIAGDSIKQTLVIYSDQIKLKLSGFIKEDAPYDLNHHKLFSRRVAKTYRQLGIVNEFNPISYRHIKKDKLIFGTGINYSQINGGIDVTGEYTDTRDTLFSEMRYFLVDSIKHRGNIFHGIRMHLRLFMAYSQNVGTKTLKVIEIKGAYQESSGNEGDHFFRISSNLAYKIGHVPFNGEIKYTLERYWKYDLNDPIKVNQHKLINNFRPMLSACYFF